MTLSNIYTYYIYYNIYNMYKYIIDIKRHPPSRTLLSTGSVQVILNFTNGTV